jgi:riboflavin biosynthesis pyrimidine reductase
MAEIEELRAVISSALHAGRTACADNPALIAEIAPLLSRLDEIREEIDAVEASRVMTGGELYPFWSKLMEKERS